MANKNPHTSAKRNAMHTMKQRLKSILTFFCWLSVLLMWGSAASVYVNPATYGRYFGVLGLAFPVFVAFVLLMLAFSAILLQRQAFICLFGLAACCGSLRDYCPVNLTSPPPRGCLKVMSFNVMGFDGMKKDGRDYAVPRFIVDNQPDIVAMQEAFATDADAAEITAYFRRYGYHFDRCFTAASPVAVASKYPIVRKETVCHTPTNGVAAFTLRTSARDSIILVCAHLQSMGLSETIRQSFRQMVEKPQEARAIHGKRVLVSRIATASHARALMADTLAAFLDRHAGEPVVLMGDFNDTPISYAHHMACTRLTDAYRATANGIGRSFHRDAIYVRIDNIFCSAHWKPFACIVDDTVDLSDHYPIVAYLKRQ